MTGDDEAALYALSAEPRSARAGETIRIGFRTRNVGTAPSPPGTVVFALGDGLEPSGPLEVAVEPVAPGEDVVATVGARVAPPGAERTEIVVRAALHVPGAVLRTNACTIVVHGRPAFDGAGSGTFVEALDAYTVRVRAVVTNEGDGPARAVRIVVPVPAGCERADGRGEEILDIPRLDVGESVCAQFEARIAAIVSEIRADGGVVCLGDGRRVALAVRCGVVPEPVLPAPQVVVSAMRRRADVVVEVRNDGWADARDVCVRAELPPGLKWIADGFAVDGAPVGARPAGTGALARLERDGDGRAVVISAVPARASVRVAFGATYGPACASGLIVVRAGMHAVEAPFAPVRARDVRVRLVDAVRIVSPGEAFTVAARVENAGDLTERLAFGIAGLPFAEHVFVSRMVAAGCGAEVKLQIAVPDDVPDGASFAAAFVATGDDGESARAPFAVDVRQRVAADAEETLLGESLLDDAAIVDRPTLRTELSVPETATAGAPFGVRLAVGVDAPVDTLTVRSVAPDGAAYVPGTAVLDGRVLLDGHPFAVCPFDGHGLVVRSIPAGTRLTFAWSLRADDPPVEPIVVVARLDADGESRVVTSPEITVRTRDAFAARPSGTPYHVESCAVAPASWPPFAAGCVDADARPIDVPEVELDPRGIEAYESARAAAPDVDVLAATIAVPHVDGLAATIASLNTEPIETRTVPVAEEQPDPDEPSLRLDGERRSEIERLFMRAPCEGLVAHLFMLRFFFPDALGADPAVAAALDGVRCALRDVFDRLFVKLRIPGFDVSSDDLEDADLRAASIRLFERLAPQRCDAADVLTMLADAPYGSPSVLRALVSLLPGRCDGDPAAGAALARYASAIGDALARYEGLPLEIFDDALAHRSDRALDDARPELLEALRSHVAAAALAC
jgi:hypothetical protein